MTSIDEIDDLHTAKQLLKLLAGENDWLHRRLHELATNVARLEGRGEGEQMSLELSWLKEHLQRLEKRVFGNSSERRPGEKPNTPKPEKKGHGPRPQPELPVVELVEELEPEAQVCPKCSGPLQAMRGQTEDAEFVTRIERTYRLVRESRQKYRCTCNEAVVTAPASAYKLVKGGRYDAAFGVGVVIDKYVDHLPLERQCRIMAREGLAIDSQTLWDQVAAVATHLAPSYLALRDYVLSADVIGADETWWRLMGGRSSTRWWAWGITTHDACWYQISPSRSGATAKEVLAGFEGTVLCDGYKAYEMVANAAPNIRLAHCWAHARRNFVEAEPNYPQACGEALAMIGELFAIERSLRAPDELEGDAKMEAVRERKRVRSEESQPIIEKLKKWALEQHGLPKSGLRKATDYLLAYWKGLTAFLEDPLLSLDNNRTERALRGMVIGRKNHYGSRSEAGTRAAAVLYSLVESAKLAEVDPAEYLLLATTRAIGKPGSILLPHQLAAAQR